MKLIEPLIIFVIMYFLFIPIVIKPRLIAKRLYLQVMNQYSPIGVLRIRIDDSDNGSLKQIPFDRKQCYLLLYENEISVVTKDEPLIRINIPNNYFKSYRIEKNDYIKFKYVENYKTIEIDLSIYPVDREREYFNKYALKQFNYYQYFEAHIPKGDQSPTIISL